MRNGQFCINNSSQIGHKQDIKIDHQFTDRSEIRQEKISHIQKTKMLRETLGKSNNCYSFYATQLILVSNEQKEMLYKTKLASLNSISMLCVFFFQNIVNFQHSVLKPGVAHTMSKIKKKNRNIALQSIQFPFILYKYHPCSSKTEAVLLF